MKRSIKHFRKRTQEELEVLQQLIVKHIKGCEMIILYGSYARGNYVLWDNRIEFGVNTCYQSDYDILVVVSASNVKITEDRIKDKVIGPYEYLFSNKSRYTQPEIIVEFVDTLNRALERKQYFFTDIVREGIKLYDTKNFKLAKPQQLSFAEIRDYAVEEFERVYSNGVNLLNGVIEHYYPKEDYINSSFIAHQVCEKFYNAISLVFTNYRPKSHKLAKLSAQTKRFCNELVTVFPLDTEFEKRCYDLLCRAYIEARYNKDFAVTREELEYMLQRIEFLKELTHKICTDKIASYDTLIAENEQ